jgi:hypothetical protein
MWKVKRMTIENGEQYGDEWVALCELQDKDTGTGAFEAVPFSLLDVETDPDFVLLQLTDLLYTPNDWTPE